MPGVTLLATRARAATLCRPRVPAVAAFLSPPDILKPIKGKKAKVYICTKAADADAAKADPNLDNVQAEEIRLSEMQLRTDPNTRDPISAYMAPSATNEPQLALTTERSVAEYWACVAVSTDRHDRPQEESNPIVLVLDGGRLLELTYPLTQFDEQIWRDEEGDVNYGIACLQDIDPLSEVLIVTEPVTSEKYNEFIKHGREAVWHPAPPLRRQHHRRP
jgi:hypothetical protein